MSVGAFQSSADHARAWHEARRTRHARTGMQVAIASISFLWTYAILQLLHDAKLDPPAVKALAEIPLFARFLASAGCSLALGLVGGIVVREPDRQLGVVPRLLAGSIAVFALVVLLFP